MELHFKEFILLQERQKIDVVFDEDDINYLKQFPKRHQQKALQARYGKFLCSALDSQGNIRPEWDDRQVLKIKRQGLGRDSWATYEVDTGVSKLMQKLQAQGYDLSQACKTRPDPLGVTGGNTMYDWRNKSSNKEDLSPKVWGGKEDLKPNVWGFSSNWPKKETSTPEEKQDIWNRIADRVQARANHIFQTTLNYFSDPNTAFHINYYYWKEPDKKQQMINGAVEHVKQKIAEDPKIEKQGRISYWISNYINVNFKRGNAKISLIKSAVENGLDLPELFNQGYTINQIIKSIKYGATDVRPGRPLSWKFRNLMKQQGIAPPKRQFRYQLGSEPEPESEPNFLRAVV